MSQEKLFYRMSKGYYHMPISTSRWCVYHEVYSGPFKKDRCKISKVESYENNSSEVKNFLKKIKFIK